MVDQSELKLKELQHRFKNLLTVVQALSSYTLRSATTLEEAASCLNDRLTAMGRSIDVLLQSEWQPVSLRTLIDLCLGHRSAFRGQVKVDGPEIVIESSAVTSLVLALHELETNAIKYGALSDKRGNVSISWRLFEGERKQPHLWLQWIETGGPEIKNVGKPGFGTRLATSLLERQTKGYVELDFVPSGLTWHLVAPLSSALQST